MWIVITQHPADELIDKDGLEIADSKLPVERLRPASNDSYRSHSARRR
jgi:hypothetical protein